MDVNSLVVEIADIGFDLRLAPFQAKSPLSLDVPKRIAIKSAE